MKNRKQAFTLAEVLLVLAIIGVIAAVTIPAVMQQSSEKKFAALAKKAQSTIQNAMDLKIATVPIGPGDMGVNLLVWLLDGEDDGTNTLKAVKRNTNSTAIQTPDGMIFYWPNGNCNTASTRTNLIGCEGYLYVDLNGAEGPTKNDASENLTISNFTGQKSYDTITLYINKDAKIKSVTGWYYTYIGNRTKKYLGIE